MIKDLIIIGTGETARLAFEYFTYDSDLNPVAFLVNSEYRKENEFQGLPVKDLENIEDEFPSDKFLVFVALASKHLNRDRTTVFNHIKGKGYTCASYISSKAFIWHDVEIGENCFILENNVLQSGVKIGDNNTLWSGNHIGHMTQIKNNCFITSHVVISGFCTVNDNSFIGVNSSIADEVEIAKDNFISMATVISRNTKEDKIYKGPTGEESRISAKRFCKVGE